MDDYPLIEDMVADGVEPYPIDLWTWGIVNEDALRYRPKDLLDLDNVDKVQRTYRGIK